MTKESTLLGGGAGFALSQFRKVIAMFDFTALFDLFAQILALFNIFTWF